MIAAEIAEALGGARRSGRWWRCRCPVHSSHSATLALRNKRGGHLVVVCHAGCSRIDILAELTQRGLTSHDFGIPTEPEIASAVLDDDGSRRIALARRIWDRTRSAAGTPVAAYLAGRGITTPVPTSLRWTAALRRPDGSYGPSMVARVDNVVGLFIGVHRTWLTRDLSGLWRRSDRASLGPIGGGSVRLGPIHPGIPLVIAEGIESAFAASELIVCPSWAALSACGIERLALPAEASDIIIAIDRDRSGIGERSARRAARRWVREGRRVRLLIPDRIGADPNDLLLEGGRAP